MNLQSRQAGGFEGTQGHWWWEVNTDESIETVYDWNSTVNNLINQGVSKIF